MKIILTSKNFFLLPNTASVAVILCFLMASVLKGIAQPTCDAHFSYVQQPPPNSVMFQPVQSPNGTTYIWNYGDGVIDSSNTYVPVHTYASAGTYYVCLSISRSFFGTCTDSYCDSVMVLPPPPPSCNAQFAYTPDTSANGILFYNFYISNTATYVWNFGDGNTSGSIDPAHAYSSPGVYYVCLTITDTTLNGTCTDTQCDSVYVTVPPPPVCNAHFSVSPLFPSNNILFVDGSNSSTATFSWNFGDGQVSSQSSSVQHLYSSAGTYYVCLTVTDSTSAGTCTDTWCDSVNVAMPPPPVCNAHFSSFSLPGHIHFVANINSASATYLWDFGDGGTSTQPFSITHAYASAGTYYVCLTVRDSTSSGTCTDTWCDSASTRQIGPPPPTCDAHFATSIMPGPHAVMFHPVQSPAGTTYHWDFGDGDTSNQFIPTHHYSSGGIYNVCLIVSRSFFGTCADTFCTGVTARISNNSDDVSAANIILYPNPANTSAIVSVSNAGSSVSFVLYNNTGQVALRKDNLSNGSFTIDARNLPSGIYFYCLSDDSQILTKGKWVIQK